MTFIILLNGFTLKLCDLVSLLTKMHLASMKGVSLRCLLPMALLDDEEDVNQIIADELFAYEAKLAQVT